ncbi:MAG: HNH endonuclease [Acidimicrobiia bacterium]
MTREVDSPLSIDALEQFMVDEERQISHHRANQIAALELLDRAQVATADGSRNLSEWVTARIDLSHETGKSLVRTMRRTGERPELREALESGEASFDRVEAASRIDPPCPDPLWMHLDVPGVLLEAANRARITGDEEKRTVLDNHLVMQPTLDESWWRIWGGLDGVTGAIVDHAVNRAADDLPIGPEAPRDSSWRRVMGLAQLCMGEEPPSAHISVFVDADLAVPADGRAGVYLEAGPRVGSHALEAVMCDAVSEVVAIGGDAEPMRYGRRSRTIPPALRRAIIHRDRNRCVIDGCSSRNRLQVHHVVPWSRGGPTDPSNLITVCWYHHHIAIHEMRLEPFRHPDHGRWRLRPPCRPPPD